MCFWSPLVRELLELACAGVTKRGRSEHIPHYHLGGHITVFVSIAPTCMPNLRTINRGVSEAFGF